jgi:hypothetical protein
LAEFRCALAAYAYISANSPQAKNILSIKVRIDVAGKGNNNNNFTRAYGEILMFISRVDGLTGYLHFHICWHSFRSRAETTANQHAAQDPRQ